MTWRFPYPVTEPPRFWSAPAGPTSRTLPAQLAALTAALSHQALGDPPSPRPAAWSLPGGKGECPMSRPTRTRRDEPPKRPVEVHRVPSVATPPPPPAPPLERVAASRLMPEERALLDAVHAAFMRGDTLYPPVLTDLARAYSVAIRTPGAAH
jgi:hypothetical protein